MRFNSRFLQAVFLLIAIPLVFSLPLKPHNHPHRNQDADHMLMTRGESSNNNVVGNIVAEGLLDNLGLGKLNIVGDALNPLFNIVDSTTGQVIGTLKGAIPADLLNVLKNALGGGAGAGDLLSGLLGNTKNVDGKSPTEALAAVKDILHTMTLELASPTNAPKAATTGTGSIVNATPAPISNVAAVAPQAIANIAAPVTHAARDLPLPINNLFGTASGPLGLVSGAAPLGVVTGTLGTVASTAPAPVQNTASTPLDIATGAIDHGTSDPVAAVANTIQLVSSGVAGVPLSAAGAAVAGTPVGAIVANKAAPVADSNPAAKVLAAAPTESVVAIPGSIIDAAHAGPADVAQGPVAIAGNTPSTAQAGTGLVGTITSAAPVNPVQHLQSAPVNPIELAKSAPMNLVAVAQSVTQGHAPVNPAAVVNKVPVNPLDVAHTVAGSAPVNPLNVAQTVTGIAPIDPMNIVNSAAGSAPINPLNVVIGGNPGASALAGATGGILAAVGSHN